AGEVAAAAEERNQGHPDGRPRKAFQENGGHAGVAVEHGQDPPLPGIDRAAAAAGEERANDAATGETIMSETFTCGDHGALVSYLYDECAPNERRAISAHMAICRECAKELTSLGATREQLATWTPPEAQLGFRIVADNPSSNVLRPSRWWQKPMPAWAQAAAAALIFATGVTLGALRGVTSPS